MENKRTYALLLGVGNYKEMEIGNLPTYHMDTAMIQKALIDGLKVTEENVRTMTGEKKDGFVQIGDFAKSMASFQNCLTSEDTFLLYFSGHGGGDTLVFSDGEISLQSVIQFVETLPSKNKVILLDCCYSGNFRSTKAKQLHFEQSIDDFAGHGIAVFASSAADEVSRLAFDDSHSIFTGALSTAILSGRGRKKGFISLESIQQETKFFVSAWNQRYPHKTQHPIYRSSMGGTIYFPVEEYNEYTTEKPCWKQDEYEVVEVKALSTGKIKRLSAFVVLRGENKIENLPQYTRQIAKRIKCAKVYDSKVGEQRHGNAQARAIWCYFGLDEEDIVNHLYTAYTIWVGDEKAKTLYFRKNTSSKEIDGIYIWENKSYSMLKKMQTQTISRKEYIKENQKLLAAIVSRAECFIQDLQEVDNQTLSMKDLKKIYQPWIQEVQSLYLKVSDLDVPPKEIHCWAEKIADLAGWVTDMSLILEHYGENRNESQIWLIKNMVKRYYEGLEWLRKNKKKGE